MDVTRASGYLGGMKSRSGNTAADSAFYPGDRPAEGAGRRRRLELTGPGPGGQGLYRGHPLAKSRGVPAGPRPGPRIPGPQMGAGAGLPADQGTLGIHRRTALPCGSPTSGMTIQGNGFAAMATRTGNSMKQDSCSDASQASTTCPSRRHSASSTGRSDAGRMIIRHSASWGCKHMRLTLPVIVGVLMSAASNAQTPQQATSQEPRRPLHRRRRKCLPLYRPGPPHRITSTCWTCWVSSSCARARMAGIHRRRTR